MNAIEQEALEEFQAGYSCAEAVIRTTMRHHSPESLPVASRMASGFVAGVGKTKEDVCGALVGGVMALGMLYGRKDVSEDPQKMLDITTEYRARFLKHCGSSSCPKLLEGFGEQEDMLKCKKMAAEVTGILANLIEENPR